MIFLSGNSRVTSRPTRAPRVTTTKRVDSHCTTPDHPYCGKYASKKDHYCKQEWVLNHCKNLCGICGKCQIVWLIYFCQLYFSGCQMCLRGRHNVSNCLPCFAFRSLPHILWVKLSIPLIGGIEIIELIITPTSWPTHEVLLEVEVLK